MGWGAVFFFLVLHRVISKNWTKDLLITRNEIVSNYTYYYGNKYAYKRSNIAGKLNEGSFNSGCLFVLA